MSDRNPKTSPSSAKTTKSTKGGKNNNVKQGVAPKIFLLCVLTLIGAFAAVACRVLADNPGDVIDPSESTQVGASASESSVTVPQASETETVVNATVTDTTAVQTTAPVTQPPVQTTAVQTTRASSGSGLPEPEIISVATGDTGWELTLVNTWYRLPDGYVPQVEYLDCGDCRLDYRIADKYDEMYEAGRADGVTLTPYSGYRTYATQKNNFNNKIAYYESQGYGRDEAEVQASRWIMPPGSSEHNLGFAMDIVCTQEWFENTDEFEWLCEHAADYGFILRYAADKTDITGVAYEPWHWRYVGVEEAKKIKASGLCLEEYLGKVN